MPSPPVTEDFDRSRSPDFFNNLLFNCERVYQSFRRFSPIKPNAVKVEKPAKDQSIESGGSVIQSTEKEQEGQGMSVRRSPRLYGMERIDMALKWPWKPRRKTSTGAKPAGLPRVRTTKKRSPPAATKTERAAKIQKTTPKANTKKRVNDRSSSMLDTFVISDNEEDDSDLPWFDSLTPPRRVQKINSPSSEDELNPILTLTSTQTQTHGSHLETVLALVKAEHTRELERLRLKLSLSEGKVAQIKKKAEREARELQRRQSVTSEKHKADWEEKLETERKRSSDLSWECDHLRREMEAARRYLKGEANMAQQRDEYERLYKEEQDTHAVAVRGMEEKSQQTACKANEMADEVQQLAKQTADLQREVNELRDENAALRISMPRTDSPAPSLSSSPSTSAPYADLRLVNIRKTYITVKRRYDNLHSVASNISTATRSWDYGSFGEFGQYLRQLRMAIDENAPEGQSHVSSSQLARVE